MKKKTLVSALIAAHNEEAHVSNCANSLLNQSYKDIEILIIENGDSRDKTFEIAKEFENKYKNVKAFSIPGKQRGPGNAWNLGIKKAKGEIIMICGADLIYGKDYIKEGIKTIIEGKNNGIVHIEEKCNNLNNLWARAFFKQRPSFDETGLSRVFTLVRKDYLESRPFNPDLGYADDQTIFRTEGTRFPTVNLEVYHTNPASFKDTWDHSVWVAKSIKNKMLIILMLPIFPIYSIYKTIKHLRKDFYSPFIYFLPFYYSVKYFAYFKEAVKSYL